MVEADNNQQWSVARRPGAFWVALIFGCAILIFIVAVNIAKGPNLEWTLSASVLFFVPLAVIIPQRLHRIEVLRDRMVYRSYLSWSTIRFDRVRYMELGGIKSHWRDKAGPLERLMIKLADGKEISINPAFFEPQQFARFVDHLSERSGVPVKGW